MIQEQYVNKTEDGYRVANSRISLESVIFAFLNGLSPETIVTECFPTLSLEQVYGIITYYLGHRAEIDSYLQKMEQETQSFQTTHRDSEFSQKILRTRRQTQPVSLSTTVR